MRKKEVSQMQSVFFGTVTKYEMTKFEKGDDKPRKFEIIFPLVLPNHCFESDQLQLVKLKNNFKFRIY
jgi:hypothetical protein